MFEAVQTLKAEYAELERQMSDPELHSDQAIARQVGKRYAALAPVVRTYDEWLQTAGDIEAAQELAAEDPAFAEEATKLEARREELAEKLQVLLVPRDPSDDKDAILEIKAGEGGDESALFAGDLLKMYLKYAESQNWKTEVLDSAESDLGGYKSITVAVKAKGTPEPGEAPYAKLKFEGGVHRVQRVPVTESQGRIHTSAAGVLVLPEAEDVDVEIDPNDLRIDVFRSSGPGGQSVNTTDSAVRITHLPTGIVVSMQNEKSQLQNREQAMRVLRSRLLAAAQEAADQEASDARRSQIRTVDRSERIRTYNFPENRFSDHRVGYKAHNLDQVLGGELAPVIQALTEADLAARLEAVDSQVTHARPGSPRRPHDCARPASRHPTSTPPSLLALRHRHRAACSLAEPTAEQKHAVRRAGRRRRVRGNRCNISPVRRPSATGSSPSGPGSSCRRPETEVMVGWILDRLAGRRGAAGRGPVHRFRRDRRCCGDRAAGQHGARRRAVAGGLRLGPTQSRRDRRDPARGRHRRLPAGVRRPGRRGDLQPAVHPFDCLGIRHRRGPRPRPGAGAVVR